MDTQTLTEVPRLARDLLAERGWVRGSWETDDGKLCLHGAVRACSPLPGDGYIVSAVMDAHGHGTYWNDVAARTYAEVDAYLASLTITDEVLADTFGPQWEAIVRLVRQAAAMTPAQAKRLDAAWAAPRATARDAASAAAWATARDAASAAAWGVAWDVAWGVAVWGAASALVVSDLTGQHGLTQEHIDTLLAPWIAVMGDPRLTPKDTLNRGGLIGGMLV